MGIFVLALATWRVANILNEEKIAEPLRRLCGEKEIEENVFQFPDTFFGNLISCFRCVSVWAGMFIVILYLIYPPLTWPFAASTLAIFFKEHILTE